MFKVNFVENGKRRSKVADDLALEMMQQRANRDANFRIVSVKNHTTAVTRFVA